MEQHTIPSMSPPQSRALPRLLQVLNWQLVDHRATRPGIVPSVVTAIESRDTVTEDRKQSTETFPSNGTTGCETPCLTVNWNACSFLFPADLEPFSHVAMDHENSPPGYTCIWDFSMSLQELQVCILHHFVGHRPYQDLKSLTALGYRLFSFVYFHHGFSRSDTA